MEQNVTFNPYNWSPPNYITKDLEEKFTQKLRFYSTIIYWLTSSSLIFWPYHLNTISVETLENSLELKFSVKIATSLLR